MIKSDVGDIVSILNPYKFSITGSDYVISCPFAKWNHKNGIDKHPSMAISFDDTEQSKVYCFTCGVSGTLSGVLTQLSVFRPDVKPLAQRVFELDKGSVISKLDKALRRFSQPVKPLINKKALEDKDVWREEELDLFRGKLPQYILDRGVSKEVCKHWEIGYDETSSDPRVVFPIRRKDKKLVGIVGRTVINANPRYKDYFGFLKSKYLYGEHLIQPKKPIIVVEGNIDVLCVYQATKEYNVVGINGSKISQAQVDKLLSYDLPVIMALDGDKAGKRGMWGHSIGNKKYKGMVHYLKGKVPLSYIRFGETEDASSLHSIELLNRILDAKLLL